MSKSKIEEIIACLWSILWAILWANNAPIWMQFIVLFKAIFDHLTAVTFAIREIRREKTNSRNASSSKH